MCWAGGVRDGYWQVASLDAALEISRGLGARTVVHDVEPLVAAWRDGQQALDRGVADVLTRTTAVLGVVVVCFATNSARRPLGHPCLPGRAHGLSRLCEQAVPHRAPTAAFPRQRWSLAIRSPPTGVLARRLGYAFLHVVPGTACAPLGPRLLSRGGQAIPPLLFPRQR